jgi:hypothetical protein
LLSLWETEEVNSFEVFVVITCRTNNHQEASSSYSSLSFSLGVPSSIIGQARPKLYSHFLSLRSCNIHKTTFKPNNRIPKTGASHDEYPLLILDVCCCSRVPRERVHPIINLVMISDSSSPILLFSKHHHHRLYDFFYFTNISNRG